MLKNHKLAKSISDASLSEIIKQLEYKSKWKGNKLYKIKTYYPSSQICSKCDYKNESIKNLSIRKYECPNNNDAFTLSVAKGGTSGYGNNVLSYPVGLITADEVVYAGGRGTSTANTTYYLYTGIEYWTLSTMLYSGTEVAINIVDNGGGMSGQAATYTNGVRPMVSLMYGVSVTEEGAGTKDNPYIVVLQ